MTSSCVVPVAGVGDRQCPIQQRHRFLLGWQVNMRVCNHACTATQVSLDNLKEVAKLQGVGKGSIAKVSSPGPGSLQVHLVSHESIKP